MTIRRTIGLSVATADPVGARILYLDAATRTSLDEGKRRVTRTATLDGGAVAYDAGFAVADQTWRITVRAASSTVSTFLAYLVKTYNLIRITTDQGVFSAVPSRWSTDNDRATLEALIMEQLA